MARITGSDRTAARLARLDRGVRTRVGRALMQAGELIAAEARARLAPDAPPAAVAVVRRGELAVEVTATLPGAEAREFGTPRTPADPFLRPAVEAKRAGAAGLIARAVRSAPIQETE